MTSLLIAITLIAHLAIPLLLLFWVFRSRLSSNLAWTGLILMVTSYLLLMDLAGAGWAWVGHFWPWLFWLLLAVAVLGSLKRRRTLPWNPQHWKGWMGLAALLMLTAYFLSALPEFLKARTYPQPAVALSFPLQSGSYFVAHGGSSPVMNHHFAVPAQRYALDVLQTNNWGTRASGLLPQELTAYHIFGAELLAPCTGEVLATESSFEDLTPPNMDPENAAGNYVSLFCQDATLLIAHIQKGSLLVKAGDQVTVGQPIGKVGNTGNTSEPHLHLHAVKGKVTTLEGLLFEAEGIPMTFEGRFLIRNDRWKRP